MSDLKVHVQDGVLRVTINRPHKRNALSRSLLGALRETFVAQAADESLHYAVLTGEGDQCFAAGGDLAEFDALRSRDDAGALFDAASAALDAVRAFPAPVVAALNGAALGGGAELALACDYRVAAAHARTGFVQATLAITTGFGGAVDLVAALGPARAMHALGTAGSWPADMARSLGLVDAIAAPDQPLDEAVAVFMQPFIDRPAHLVRALKRMTSTYRVASADQRDAERQGFVRTWTDAAHWDAVARMLAARREKET
jgi:enoyl-CoA hydratase/carnithine racemase